MRLDLRGIVADDNHFLLKCVGRTGTLMAGRCLLERLRSNPKTIDIFGTVLALRKWRQRLVQNAVRIYAIMHSTSIPF